MEMLDLNTVWSATLTLLVSVMAYIVNEKFRELSRITILLNKTREEVARDNVTQAEVDRITNHIDQRFNKLEAKIDQLIQAGRLCQARVKLNIISWRRWLITQRLPRKQASHSLWVKILMRLTKAVNLQKVAI